MLFKNRTQAAEKLANILHDYANRKDSVILGLARGGIILASVISRILNIPFDLIMTRKVGAPFNPELAIGAITETGKGYFNEKLIKTWHIPQDAIDQKITEAKQEATRRLALYRGTRLAPNLQGKTIILVDDGIATGATMMAAALSTGFSGAKEIVIAAPIAPPSTIHFLSVITDKIFCLHITESFMAVSQFYEEFNQVTDEEIIKLLQT